MPELGLFSLLRLGGWVSGKGKGLDESNRWYTPWGATHKARATRHIDFFVGNQELTIYIAQSGKEFKWLKMCWPSMTMPLCRNCESNPSCRSAECTGSRGK